MKKRMKFCDNCSFVQDAQENLTAMEQLASKYALRILEQDRALQLKFDFENYQQIKEMAEKHKAQE